MENSSNKDSKAADSVRLTGFIIKKAGLAMDYITIEPMRKGSMVMDAERKTKSPFPPTHEVLSETDRLRYFFARACGMWYDGFDEFMGTDFCIKEVKDGSYDQFDEFTKAKNTIEAIHIEEVTIRDYYRIKASVESMDGKFIRLSTPKITDEDSIFEDLSRVMDSVVRVVKDFILDGSYDIKREAYDIVKRSIRNDEQREEVMASMSERDILLTAIEIFESKGSMLVLTPEMDAEIVAMRREKEQEDSVNAVGSAEIRVSDLEGKDMEEISTFASSESEHVNVPQSVKGMEQDWVAATPDPDEAAIQEVIESDFM